MRVAGELAVLAARHLLVLRDCSSIKARCPHGGGERHEQSRRQKDAKPRAHVSLIVGASGAGCQPTCMIGGMRFTIFTGTLAIAALTLSCSGPTPAPPAAAPAQTALWGDMKPVVSVKELMEYMIDPAGDYVFDSVSTVIDPKGNVIEKAPKTDEDWEKLRIGAVTLAEGVYLLKIPRPFAPPGDENHSVGPDATELSPAQIEAKVKKDPVEWNARIEALRNVGLEVLEIVKKKNTKELWDAAENLDEACESCHRAYWYPKEDARFYRDLDDQLKKVPNPPFAGKSPRGR